MKPNNGQIAGFMLHMVKYIGAEGAGDLAFGEGLKNGCFSVTFPLVLWHSAF